jgi:hypothetical protein
MPALRHLLEAADVSLHHHLPKITKPTIIEEIVSTSRKTISPF